MNVFCPGAGLNDSFEKFGSPSKGYDIVHSFGRTLRYRWFMLLAPIFLMNVDRPDTSKWLGKNLTKRTETATYKNEFDCETPVMEFAATDYPQHNLSLNINFRGGVPKDLKVVRLKSHAVINVDFERLPGNNIRFHISSLHKETVRIYWRNIKSLNGGFVAST